jgi:hypothetical protein
MVAVSLMMTHTPCCAGGDEGVWRKTESPDRIPDARDRLRPFSSFFLPLVCNIDQLLSVNAPTALIYRTYTPTSFRTTNFSTSKKICREREKKKREREITHRTACLQTGTQIMDSEPETMDSVIRTAVSQFFSEPISKAQHDAWWATYSPVSGQVPAFLMGIALGAFFFHEVS